MRVVLVFLMALAFMPIQAFASIDSNLGNAVYNHNTAFFSNFEKMSSDLNSINISNAVYKHPADDYSSVTSDPKVIKALNLLKGTMGEYSKEAILGQNASGRPMQIKFTDLSQISPNYANYDALGWKANGQCSILINMKHKDAPAEAIASLLSHEAMHQDEYNSLNEETYAWTMEAAVWLQMKIKNPELNKLSYISPLVNRENTLGKMFLNSNYTTKLIRHEVETNPGYAGLPKQSPTFSDNN